MRCTGGKLSCVVLSNCKLYYATFHRARAAGPVIVSKCSLTEASFALCDLSGACSDGCGLRRTEFEAGHA
ncbi:pentapeptide repeat-containing protein [Streptomyces netropsis]|uniref:pentapeptide repeat-containing protein n=1 Tax=Streptomyces netropsis TaxID=55404 RepID=UPI003BB709D4